MIIRVITFIIGFICGKYINKVISFFSNIYDKQLNFVEEILDYDEDEDE